MLVKVECSCGNVRYCRSADLMMVCGGGVDPLKLKFDCNRCKPEIKVTLLEVHPEHLPKRLMIHKPMKIGGKITWHTDGSADDNIPPIQRDGTLGMAND
ncbi:hypothetical protein [Mesorhizobium sp. BR1-1-9]|uniref:hypothetical protein n=1 Tax=Mesorhizobium sp. BR1-1-9 TaxID=2876646 RepID=UPI001CD049FB|nr:hypothetical protein [Mesorhizobium sp. BR1-1-9]